MPIKLFTAPAFATLQGYDMIFAFSEKAITDVWLPQYLNETQTGEGYIKINYVDEWYGYNEYIINAVKRQYIMMEGRGLLPPAPFNVKDVIHFYSTFAVNDSNNPTMIINRYVGPQDSSLYKGTPVHTFQGDPGDVTKPQVINLQVKLNKTPDSPYGPCCYVNIKSSLTNSDVDNNFRLWYENVSVSNFPLCFPLQPNKSTANDPPSLLPTDFDCAFHFDVDFNLRSSINYLVMTNNNPLPYPKPPAIVPYRNWIDQDDIQGVLVISANLVLNWFLFEFATIFNKKVDDFTQVDDHTVKIVFEDSGPFPVQEYISEQTISCLITGILTKGDKAGLCSASFILPYDRGTVDFYFDFNSDISATAKTYLTYTTYLNVSGGLDPRLQELYKKFQAMLENDYVSKYVSKQIGTLTLAPQPIAILDSPNTFLKLPEGSLFFFKDARYIDRNLVVSVTQKN